MCKIVPRYPHDSSESWLRNSLLVSRDVVILWQFRLTRLTVKLDLRFKTFKFLNTYFLASSSSSSSACSRERTFGSRLRPRVRSLGVWPRVRCGDGDRRRWTTPTEDDRLRGKVRKRSGVEFWSQKFCFKRVLRLLQYYNCSRTSLYKLQILKIKYNFENRDFKFFSWIFFPIQSRNCLNVNLWTLGSVLLRINQRFTNRSLTVTVFQFFIPPGIKK